jgi:hypothetical protein
MRVLDSNNFNQGELPMPTRELGTVVTTVKRPFPHLPYVVSTVVYQDDDTDQEEGRVFFTAHCEIDADGANGQEGKPVAYRADDTGSEALENGGMERTADGRVTYTDPSTDTAILGADGLPKIYPDGMVASKTWYVVPDVALDDPRAYLDAETVPYIVINPLVMHQTRSPVRGCFARVTWRGTSVNCVVGDLSGDHRIGEISIAAARALGIPNLSPRNGGVSAAEVVYEVWPGQAAPGFVLQPA